jgi:hypothetical protein
MKAGRDQAVFLEGQHPGPMIEFRWRMDESPKELAFSFVRKSVWFLDEPVPKASDDQIRAAMALADRVTGLRKMLGGGSLVAYGTFSTTGLEQAISPRQWLRANISVDVRNSDFIDGVDGKSGPRWTGLFLSLPSPDSVATPALQLREASLTTTNENQAHSESQISRKNLVSSAATFSACKNWLIEAMRSSPGTRIETKAWWWKKAQEKWIKSLSRRGFDAAWAEAVRATRAAAWASAGAPRKSPQPESAR